MNAYFFWNAKKGSQIVVVATCQTQAQAEYSKITGKVHKPRFRKKVIIATANDFEMQRIEQIGVSPETKYGTEDEDSFPLLSYFGIGSISPEWVIDRKSGKIELAGEFQSLPKELLDFSGKPTQAECLAMQARNENGSNWDLLVAHINEAVPWLNLSDGNDLLDRLLVECNVWERRYRHEAV